MGTLTFSLGRNISVLKTLLILGLWVFSAAAAEGDIVIESLPSFATVSEQPEAVMHGNLIRTLI